MTPHDDLVRYQPPTTIVVLSTETKQAMLSFDA